MLTVDFILVDDNLEPAWQSRTKLETVDGPTWVVSRDAAKRLKLPARRLDAKLDMSPKGVAARLREASELLALCQRLAVASR